MPHSFPQCTVYNSREDIQGKNSWFYVSHGMWGSGRLCVGMYYLMDWLSHRGIPFKQMVTWVGKVTYALSWPFLCPCVMSFFESGKSAATTQQCRQKHSSSSLEQDVEESLTLIVCERGNWTMTVCEMSGWQNIYLCICQTFLVLMNCWLTHCWWWNLPTRCGL